MNENQLKMILTFLEARGLLGTAFEVAFQSREDPNELDHRSLKTHKPMIRIFLQRGEERNMRLTIQIKHLRLVFLVSNLLELARSRLARMPRRRRFLVCSRSNRSFRLLLQPHRSESTRSLSVLEWSDECFRLSFYTRSGGRLGVCEVERFVSRGHAEVETAVEERCSGRSRSDGESVRGDGEMRGPKRSGRVGLRSITRRGDQR